MGSARALCNFQSTRRAVTGFSERPLRDVSIIDSSVCAIRFLDFTRITHSLAARRGRWLKIDGRRENVTRGAQDHSLITRYIIFESQLVDEPSSASTRFFIRGDGARKGARVLERAISKIRIVKVPHKGEAVSGLDAYGSSRRRPRASLRYFSDNDVIRERTRRKRADFGVNLCVFQRAFVKSSRKIYLPIV